jgi:hypothetical protein
MRLFSYTDSFCCPAGRDGGQWRVVDICPWWGITPVLLGHIYPSCPAFSSLCTRAALCIPQPCSSKPEAKSWETQTTFQLVLGTKHIAPVFWTLKTQNESLLKQWRKYVSNVINILCRYLEKFKSADEACEKKTSCVIILFLHTSTCIL